MAATADRDLAINYLRYWYKASNVSRFVSANYITYQDFLGKIDTGGFLSSIGSSMHSIRQDKVQAAFEKLAADQPDAVPSQSDFFNYLAAQVGNFTVSDAASAAGAAIQTEAKAGIALGGALVGGYALWIALGAALLILPMMVRAKGAAKELL